MPKREQFFNTLLGESQGHVIVKHNLLFFSASGGIGDRYLFFVMPPPGRRPYGPEAKIWPLSGAFQNGLLRHNP